MKRPPTLDEILKHIKDNEAHLVSISYNMGQEHETHVYLDGEDVTDT